VIGALFLVVFARVVTYVGRLNRARRNRGTAPTFTSQNSRVFVPALRMIAGGLSFRGPPVLSSL
jgi:hypothetical protein